MQGTRILLCIFGFIILASCGNSNNSVNQNGTNDPEATQAEATQAEDQESEEAEDVVVEQESKENEAVEEKAPANPSGAKEILEATAKAMNEIDGMALEGKTESNTKMSGMDMDETSETTGIVTIDPYAQHITGTSTNDIDGEIAMEVYSANQKTYVKSEDGWMTVPFGADGMSAAMTGAYFENFAAHADEFEVSEEDGNYVLSFSGSGDTYKEIAYGGLKEMWGEEAYESLISLFEEMSGSYQFSIDKESFLVTALTYDMEFTMGMGIVNTDHGTYTYSKFNEVDEVVVPDEVIENAEKLPDMSDLQVE